MPGVSEFEITQTGGRIKPKANSHRRRGPPERYLKARMSKKVLKAQLEARAARAAKAANLALRKKLAMDPVLGDYLNMRKRKPKDAPGRDYSYPKGKAGRRTAPRFPIPAPAPPTQQAADPYANITGPNFIMLDGGDEPEFTGGSLTKNRKAAREWAKKQVAAAKAKKTQLVQKADKAIKQLDAKIAGGATPKEVAKETLKAGAAVEDLDGNPTMATKLRFIEKLLGGATALGAVALTTPMINRLRAVLAAPADPQQQQANLAAVYRDYQPPGGVTQFNPEGDFHPSAFEGQGLLGKQASDIITAQLSGNLLDNPIGGGILSKRAQRVLGTLAALGAAGYTAHKGHQTLQSYGGIKGIAGELKSAKQQAFPTYKRGGLYLDAAGNLMDTVNGRGFMEDPVKWTKGMVKAFKSIAKEKAPTNAHVVGLHYIGRQLAGAARKATDIAKSVIGGQIGRTPIAIRDTQQALAAPTTAVALRGGHELSAATAAWRANREERLMKKLEEAGLSFSPGERVRNAQLKASDKMAEAAYLGLGNAAGMAVKGGIKTGELGARALTAAANAGVNAAAGAANYGAELAGEALGELDAQLKSAIRSGVRKGVRFVKDNMPPPSTFAGFALAAHQYLKRRYPNRNVPMAALAWTGEALRQAFGTLANAFNQPPAAINNAVQLAIQANPQGAPDPDVIEVIVPAIQHVVHTIYSSSDEESTDTYDTDIEGEGLKKAMRGAFKHAEAGRFDKAVAAHRNAMMKHGGGPIAKKGWSYIARLAKQAGVKLTPVKA